jgi:cytochrome c peroxidase
VVEVGEALLGHGGFGSEPNPRGGFGNGTFNTPTLIEAADSGPFFHDNAIETIEEAVGFYNANADGKG